MTNLFLTGATGYIGGQVLHELTNAAQFKISALVRDDGKAAKIQAAYPNVRIVKGDLDNSELLRNEASKSSIVLHLAATGHLESVKAIHAGLASQASEDTAYWIQVSGASALAAAELASSAFVPGSASSAVFDDLDGVTDVRSMIRKYPSRAVDNYILNEVSTKSNIKTALVFPPIIYGAGEGPVNQRSVQIPQLVNATIRLGHGIQLGLGQSCWGNVHIRDIGKLFSLLAEAAAVNNNHDHLWGQNGLYLTDVAEQNFGDISAKVARVAKQRSLVNTDEVKQLTVEDFEKVIPHGKVLFGTNARGKAVRAKTILGWHPSGPTLDEEILRLVDAESQSG